MFVADWPLNYTFFFSIYYSLIKGLFVYALARQYFEIHEVHMLLYVSLFR